MRLAWWRSSRTIRAPPAPSTPHLPPRAALVEACARVRDAACPLSTRGGTRLVRLVRGGGGAGQGWQADRRARAQARARAHPDRSRSCRLRRFLSRMATAVAPASPMRFIDSRSSLQEGM